MKKIIIIILLIVFSSGCSVDYNLNIDENNNFYEEISIQTENALESQQLYSDPWPIKALYSDPDLGESPEKIEGVSYYEDKMTLNQEYYKRDLKYNFNKEEFKDVDSIKTCYEHFYLTENDDENTITLATSAEFLCMVDYPSLNEVNINITVANPVLASNATTIDGNTYKWQITRENYESSGLILTFQKDNTRKREKINISEKPQYVLLILGVFVLLIFGIIIYKIKRNK